MSVTVSLNTDAPPDNLYLLEVVEAAAECIHVANYQLRSHAALESPAEADVMLASLMVMAARMPQLLDQAARWLEEEAGLGRLEVTSGKFATRPGLAVRVARVSLDAAADRFGAAQRSLAAAHQVTATIAPAGSGEEES